MLSTVVLPNLSKLVFEFTVVLLFDWLPIIKREPSKPNYDMLAHFADVLMKIFFFFVILVRLENPVSCLKKRWIYSFPKDMITKCEMQIALFEIWTLLAKSIFYDNNIICHVCLCFIAVWIIMVQFVDRMLIFLVYWLLYKKKNVLLSIFLPQSFLKQIWNQIISIYKAFLPLDHSIINISLKHKWYLWGFFCFFTPDWCLVHFF